MTIIITPTPERPLAYWRRHFIPSEIITSPIDGVTRIYIYVVR